MAKKIVKSKIKQALDQLSLDFAEGAFLNIITANYGLDRPPAGYSDDEWRAIAKLIQVQNKTPSEKIASVLEIVLGPRQPFAGAIKSPINPGDTQIELWDTSGLPQVGTLYIHKGSISEEMIKYRFVDYSTNTVYLSSPVVAASGTIPAENEPVAREVLSRNADTRLCLPVTDSINPSSTCVVKNSTYNEIFNIGAILPGTNYCTVSSRAGSGLLPSYKVTPISATLPTAYQTGSFYLKASGVSAFPTKGYIQIIPATGAATHTITGSSTTSVLSSTGWDADNLAGYKIKFTGNVTPALANKVATVVYNSSSSLNLDEALTTAPSVGDTFTLIPVVAYTKVDYPSNSIYLRVPLTTKASVPAGSKIEVLDDIVTIKNASIYVPAGGWRMYQADNRKIYISLATKSTLNNPFSASFLSKYPSILPTTSTTAVFSGNTLSVASTSSFPLTGVIRYQPAGADIHLGYYVSSGTTLTIPYPPSSASTIVSGQPVTLHAPVYSGTTLRDGNHLFNVGNGAKYPSWLGPYIMKQGYTPCILSAATLAQHVSGPTKLEVSVTPSVSPSVLEVEDSAYAPLNSSFLCRVGTEVFTVTKNSLKSVARATLSSNISAGATTFSAIGTTSNSTLGGAFPTVANYRIVLGANSSNEEIVLVSGLSSGTFTLSSPTTKSHSSGDVITLAADCLSVTQIDYNHTGRLASPLPSVQPHSNPFSCYSSFNSPDTVEFLYNQLTVTSPTDISSWTTGSIRLGAFGVPKSYVIGTGSLGSTGLTVDSVSGLPPPPFKIKVGDVLGRGAVHSVSAVTSSLTLSFPLKFDVSNQTCILPGETEEICQLTSVSSSNLLLGDYVSFKSDHSSGTAIYRLEERETPASYIGTNFSLRIPADYKFKISFILDLVKAAGVQIVFK